MIIENLLTFKIHKLTQEQYDRELALGNLDENALYLTPSDTSPVRGVDYWTEEDKAEIKAYVDEAILGGAW